MTSEYIHVTRLAELDASSDHGVYTAFAVLQGLRVGRTRNGQAFLDLELGDASGTLSGKVWGSDHPGVVERASSLQRGSAVKILFQVGSYRDQVQLKVENLRPAQPEDDGFDADALFGEGADAVDDLYCKALVFDIETVPAVDLRELPPTIAKALTKSAERGDNDEGKVMSLSPYFGKVVSLAVGEGDIDLKEQKVTVLAVPPPGRENDTFPPWMRPMSEPELLRAFWHLAARAEVVVSYNGRGFDLPFLVVRSLIHGIPARVDLLSNRFSLRPHLDLYQVINTSRGLGPSSLDVVCWALGIESPKGVMDGSMVAPTYQRGEIETIAEYNAGDVTATTAVYQHVREELLRFRDDW